MEKSGELWLTILLGPPSYRGDHMSNLEIPRFTEWTSTNLERPHRLPHVCTKIIYGKLGGYRLKEKWMIYLAPERRPCFLFVQAKFKWGVNENIQGKDVQAASERNVFTGTWLPILRIPFSADHFMDIKKNIIWGARSFVVPNLVHKRRQKSMFKITLPWKGVSPIWKGPIAYLVFLTTSIRIHKPMSDPCMFSIAGFFLR